ncbi:MAG TPA: hypothetical protein VME23_10395 [Terracidiphilus sp.]|nr:hypothetical protein [Terracidiphilus sp.]
MGSVSSIASAASLSASAVSQLMSDVSFSTTVNGKTYNADVTSSNGEYVADDPDLSGAEATGSSVEAAENNLSTRIEVIV